MKNLMTMEIVFMNLKFVKEHKMPLDGILALETVKMVLTKKSTSAMACMLNMLMEY